MREKSKRLKSLRNTHGDDKVERPKVVKPPVMNYQMKVDDGIILCAIHKKPQSQGEREQLEKSGRKATIENQERSKSTESDDK